jgi:hypothetical protein
VCSIAGVFVIPLVLGVVFGFVARGQIRASGGTQGGDSLAIAGIVIGFAWAALIVLGLVLNATHTNSGSGVVGLMH